jgi:DNA-binding CsgD family transcriptional regulator/tetratricopeptide (TPR) repeat protein
MSTSPVAEVAFVGRDTELRLLVTQLEQAAMGSGRLALLAGDAGIGKTRLAEELARLAHSRHTAVTWSRCYESEGAPAFWPWIQVLRVLLESWAPRPPLAPEIASLLSEDSVLDPPASQSGEESPDTVTSLRLSVDGSARARFRLFEAVAALFRAYCLQHGTQVFILDDLQWADTSSLLLLQYLARSLVELPLLIVGVYRHTDIGADHPFTTALRTVRRERSCVHLELKGLTPAATAALIGAGSASAPFTRAMHTFTDGNPLFVREIVRHLTDTGGLPALLALADEASVRRNLTAPEGVRGVIRVRLQRLSAAARRVLGVAAVVGREFDMLTLRGVDDLRGAPLLESLDEAEAARLVIVRPGPILTASFVHDLVRETLYADLGQARRVNVHHQVGAALESRWGSETAAHASELAYHFTQAVPGGDADRALTYARMAGEQALGHFAYDEAARWLRVVFELLDATGADGSERCDALLALSEACLMSGSPWQVVDDLAPAALALAEHMGEAGEVRAARACRLALTGLIRYAGPGSLVGTPVYRLWAERAARHTRSSGSDRVHADIALADAVSVGGLPQTLALYEQSLTVARQLDDPDTLWYAAFQLLNWGGGPRHQAERLHLAHEFSVTPREGVSLRNLGRALFRCGAIFLDWGDRARAEALWHTVADLAQDGRECELLLLTPIADVIRATLDGRLEDALRACDWLVAWSAELGAPAYGRRYAARLRERALLWLGRSTAEDRAELVGLRTQPDVWTPANVVSVCLRLAQAGQRAEPQRILHDQVRAMHAHTADDAVFAWHLLSLLELAVNLGERSVCRELVDWLQPMAECGTADWGLTTVARHLAAACALLGETSAARAYYEQALEVSGRLGFRPEVALASLGLAELLESEVARTSSSPERARAAELLEAALDAFRDMHMQPALDRALRCHARVVGLTRPVKVVCEHDLTPREVEVLQLLATGRTNKEIAEALTVSPRTVQQHTMRIYAKMGARGRADAVANALQRGLLVATPY